MSLDRDSKSNYTLEEMMSAARGGSGRKRRSRQPMIEARKRRRRMVFLVLGAFALALAVSVAALLIFRNRLGTEFFRETANQRFSAMTGTDVSFGKFTAEGLTDISCGSIELKSKSGYFRMASLMKLDALMPLSNFWTPEWKINSLAIESATVTLVPKQTQAKLHSKLGDGEEDSALAASGVSYGITPAPKVVAINGFNIKKFTFRLPEGRGGDYSFEDMTAVGSYVQGVLRVTCNGGTLTGAVIPRMNLRSMVLVINKDSATIESAVVALTSRCDLEIHGTIESTDAGPVVDLGYRLPSFLLKDVWSSAWSDRVNGKVSIDDGKYTWKPGQDEVISGNFSVDGAVFQGFPANAALSDLTSSQSFDKIELKQLTGRFSRYSNRLVVENLEGSRLGQTKLSGEFTSFDNGKLKGNLVLDVNLTEVAIPGVKERDGLKTFPITLGGTHEKPEDGVGAQLPRGNANATAPQTAPPPSSPQDAVPTPTPPSAPAPAPSEPVPAPLPGTGLPGLDASSANRQPVR